MSATIGIDPGKNGGIALVTDDPTVARAINMPPTPRDLLNELQALSLDADVVYVEKVGSRPGQGVKSMFTFGRGLGLIEMAVIACDLRLEWVTPAKWQKALGCLTGGDKNVSKARAQELFPGMKITHAIADALLIAEYGRRTR